MMTKQNSKKKYFWLILLAVFLLTGGLINTSTSADTPSSDLVINEFMAANGSGLTDEDGDYSDWIELYNRGGSAVNLGGWALTDDPTQPQKWPFPDMVLGSQEYLIVFASGKNRSSTEPGTFLHTNFKLSKSGDFLALHNVLEGKFMDIISPQYPEQFRDVSYGRFGNDLNLGYLDIVTPGKPNNETFASAGSVASVSFSMERGFYEAPFTVELTSETPEATIRYTTDGTEPTEKNGTIYAEPIPIETNTLLRAAAFRSNFLPSDIKTQSYIFPEDIFTQFLDSGSLVSNSQGDIKILPAAAGINTAPVTVDKNDLRAGLKSIPAISLVMDGQSLTDLSAHPHERGKDSERPVSFELFYPDRAGSGTQINAGIRLHGEHIDSTSKQAYRLFFRGEYGSTKLEYPLYSDSPVEAFDTLLLQPSDNHNAFDDAYISNEWLRTSQIAMSGLGAHGMFVNLYLNGQYLGLYNLVERPDADFISAYIGGDKEDWFVANQAGLINDELATPASELTYLFTTLALAPTVSNDLAQPEYLAQTYAAAAAYLDPAQLIDYMLLNWYADLRGWPQTNWYAAIRPQDLPGRGRLLIGAEPIANDRQIAPLGYDQTRPSENNIHEAYFETLMQDPDFRIEFADRLYQHLFNDGALSEANARARWQNLTAAIGQTVLTESALWANLSSKPGLTQNDWLNIQNEILAGMEGSAARLLARAREAGYYPDFDPPVFSHNGGLVEAGFKLEISLPAGSCQDCTIYYTTDSSDPRLPVTGTVIPTAVAYDGPLALTTDTTQVKARVWDGQAWSALHEATFSVVEQDNKLRITEIMYNPADGDDYEFIELKNTGTSELNLAGISLDEGVRFTFPPDTPSLAPGGIALLVSNPVTFGERYPDIAISGAYEGQLSNKGEKIVLTDAKGQILLEFEYNDYGGWPLSADGRGDSLILVNESGDPNNPKNWRVSLNLNGSPGAEE